jgi:hypothetical protein
MEPWFQTLRRRGSWWPAGAAVLRVVFHILFIPVLIWRWRSERKRDDLGWYLLMQALLVFVVFSFVRTKLPHYTMPAFPCLALWLALQLRARADSLAWFQKRLAIMAAMVLVLTLGVTPVVRHFLLTENLWRAAQPYARPETKVGCFGYTEPSLVWKFRGVVTNTVVLGEAKNAAKFLTNTPPYILVLPTKDVAALGETNGVRFQVHGFDMVKLKNWDLTAIVR